MSKRESAELIKDGYSIFVKDLRELGYTPEAVVNWISLMGWSYDDHTEFFDLNDLVEKFSIDHLNPSPAAINFTKLDHFNGLHIRALSDEELTKRILPFFTEKGIAATYDNLLKIAPLLKERMATLDESVALAGFFFQEEVTPNPEELVAKGCTAKESQAIVLKTIDLLEPLSDMKLEHAEPPMREYVETSGFSAGQVFGIMRVAVTGQKVSPPLFESMEIIGKEKVIRRLKRAAELLGSM
jgi:Glutamyl- and glutaminyl-tRNA synthetases